MDKELRMKGVLSLELKDGLYVFVNYKGEQIRKDAVYSKQYLEGKYGADPAIKKGLEFLIK